MPRTSVLIVNYNGLDVVTDCLGALGRQRFKDFDVILVDNGSTDDSLDAIRDFLDKNTSLSARVIPLKGNTGFTGGNLAGFEYTKADYIALLNNDTEPDEKWLDSLLNAMEKDPSIGICASKMLVFGAGKIDSAGDGFSRNLKGFKRGEGGFSASYDNEEYIFGACAGAALYRRKMLDEIGFFDEDFFLIHEDTDLNFRAQLAGWKVLYVPTAVVHHKVRSTIGHMSDIAVYYTLRNSEFVRIKNVPFMLFFMNLPEFVLGTISEFIYFAIKHRKFRIYLRAKADALKKAKVMLRKRKSIMSMKKACSRYLYSIMTSVWSLEFFSAKLKKFFCG